MRDEVAVTGRSRVTGGAGGAGFGRVFAGGGDAGGALAVPAFCLAGGFSLGVSKTLRTRSAIWSGTTLS